MDFTALNCALENGHGGKCHVLYILPKKKQLKEGGFQKEAVSWELWVYQMSRWEFGGWG